MKTIEQNDLMNEIWKPIPGYEFYFASNLGRIKSVDRMIKWKSSHKKRLVKARVLSPGKGKNGYLTVAIGIERKSYNVHSLIMLAFVGSANGLHINHKNAIKNDNRIENLEYCTPLENNRHARKMNLIGKRVRFPKSLSHEDANTIKFFATKPELDGILSRAFNCSKLCVQRIRRGGTFMNPAMRGEDHPNSKLNEETVLKIRELYPKMKSQHKLARLLNLNRSTIHSVVTRKAWKHI